MGQLKERRAGSAVGDLVIVVVTVSVRQDASLAASPARLVDFVSKMPTDRFQGDSTIVLVYTVEQEGYH